MAELHIVRMDRIALVALEYQAICDLNGPSIWSLIGGWRGIRGMHANTGLLLALAEQASAWDRHASNVALEAMQKDLLLLRRAVLHGIYKQTLVRSSGRISSDLHGVATAYHHMTELLLGLYRHSPSRLYTHLEDAIWPTFTPMVGPV